jgi:DNA-binding transcriptional MerR regulator
VSRGDVVSSTELARELGLSPRSIQRYVKAGMITPEFVTPGGHYRWRVEKVIAELRQQRRRDDEG